MYPDTLNIAGREYQVSDEQKPLVIKAGEAFLAECDAIDSAGLGPDGLNSAYDPYAAPTEKYERRICEIMGVPS